MRPPASLRAKRSILVSSLLLLALLGCESPRAATSPPAAPTAATKVAPPPPSRTARCGVNFAHAWQNGGARGYASPTGRDALRQLAELGIVDVAITGFGWMPSLTSASVQWQQPPPGGETEAAIRAAAAAARATGQSVMLKPHLWVHGGAWQADLAPDPAAGGWPAWFASYEQFIFDQAALAAELRADWFVIGNELGSATQAAPERWASLIAGVRQRYAGKVTYAANWDEAERVTFWPLLDAIGINFYAPLSTAQPPTDADLRAGARAWLARYEKLAATSGRPLLLTEVGYRNRIGTAATPHAWPEHAPDSQTAAGDAEQAAGYRAIFDTFGRSPSVNGLYWWKAFSDPATNEEGPTGFSPIGKPAARLLAERCLSTKP